MKPRASRGAARSARSSFSAISSIAGPTASARSISRAAPRERVGADEGIALMGNHEAMMRLALELSDAAGGRDRGARNLARQRRRPHAGRVRRSRTSRPRISRRCWRRRARRCRSACAPGFGSLRPNWRSGDMLFVHAGVNPRFDLEAFLAAPWNTPLASLDEDRHWAWVRWPFLEHRPGPEGFGGYLRRPRPHAERRQARRLARGSDRPLPAQSRRRLRADRDREDGDHPRPQGGGGRRTRTDQPRVHGVVTISGLDLRDVGGPWASS